MPHPEPQMTTATTFETLRNSPDIPGPRIESIEIGAIPRVGPAAFATQIIQITRLHRAKRNVPSSRESPPINAELRYDVRRDESPIAMPLRACTPGTNAERFL